MRKPFIVRPTAWVVCPEDDRVIFGDRAYSVEIDDDGGGEYLVLRDIGASQPDRFTIDTDAWPGVEHAVHQAITEIRRHKSKTSDD